MFASWSNGIHQAIEINLIHLPGRDKRIREPLQENLSAIVRPLGEALSSLLDRPFAFFGHSMGALICFEVARYLYKQYSLQPVHLFLSGRLAPQLADPHAYIYQLPDQEFLKANQELYGDLPTIIKEDPEVLKLFLSILRADLTMMGRYQYKPEPPMNCPISIFGGSEDKSVTEEGLNAWHAQTTGTFTRMMFPGNHFFIQSSRQLLIQHIIQKLF